MDKKMFEDVVVFSVSEPGAMGPNDMTFYKKTGDTFTIDYKSDETPYSEIKEAFPMLQECFWNGPARGEKECEGTIVIGRANHDRRTRVAPGWKHIYLDYGNHLVVREELYEVLLETVEGKRNCDITFWWTDILKEKNFSSKITGLLEE